MAMYKVVVAKIPEAEHLGDLYGIRHDLEDAKVLCEAAIKSEHEKSLSTEAVAGLVSAAIVRYTRCFFEGARYRLNPTILPPENQEFHYYLVTLRSKFIAHAVNAFEDSLVTVTVGEHDGHKLLVGSGVSAGRISSLFTGKTASNLLVLTAAVLSKVDELIGPEELKVLQHIRSLPIDDVHAWPMIGSDPIVVGSDPRKTRKRHAPPQRNDS